MAAEVRAAARARSAEALEALIHVMRNEKSPPAARVAAATAILDRGWGKPQQATKTKIRRIDQMSEEQIVDALSKIDALTASREEVEGDGWRPASS